MPRPEQDVAELPIGEMGQLAGQPPVREPDFRGDLVQAIGPAAVLVVAQPAAGVVVVAAVPVAAGFFRKPSR